MKFIKSQNGVAAVEFGIILPFLLVVIFGIIEFGLLMYNKQVLTNASREGARAGIVQASPHISETAIKGIVTDYSSKSLLVNFGATTSPTITTGTCTGFGDDLTVSVTYTYNFFAFPNVIKLLNGTFSNSIDLQATTVMRCE